MIRTAFSKIFKTIQSPINALRKFHSSRYLNVPTSKKNLSMRVVQVPVLSDNYSYLLIDDDTQNCAAIDPAEPKKVIEIAKKEGVKITHILTTHHHYDHAGGNLGMLDILSNLIVVGGDKRIDGINKLVKDGDMIHVGSLTVKVFFSPCHTKGHVLYFVEDNKPPVLFTGDTLFIGGCGRFFEGTPEQMDHALNKIIKSLPLDTEIYCGHEYTVANLKFAKSVDPNNETLNKKLEWAKSQRKKGLSTIPSTLKEEIEYNPFMRVNEIEVKQNVGLPNGSDIDVMGKLRELKNAF